LAALLAQLAVNGIIWGALYALLGLSWNIIYCTTGIFHFAHALIFVAAGYAAVLVTMKAGLPLALGFLAAIIAAVVLGWALERGIYRPLRVLGASQTVIFVASLGTLIFGEAIAHIIFKPFPRRLSGFPVESINIGAVTFTNLRFATLAISYIVILGVWQYLKRTKSGKAIRAVGSNPEMAEVLGIDRDRVFLFVFALGSAIGAVAGVLYTLDSAAHPQMGMPLIFPAFIVTFVGGVGSILGVVVAGLLLGLAENISLAWLDTDYMVMISFAILLAVIILRPRGLFASGR
jgi:branched-chain amino acid transport system permease protein